MPPAGKKRTRPRLTLKVVVPIVMLSLALAKPDYSSAQSQARLRGLFLASVTLYNLAAWVLKRRITGKRDGRTVRVVSEGKSELQSVCAYDTLALEKLYTESLIVRCCTVHAALSSAADALLLAGLRLRVPPLQLLEDYNASDPPSVVSAPTAA